MKIRTFFMKLVDYVIMDCISYTIINLTLCILSSAGIVQNMGYHVMLQLFFCTTLITLVMFFTNRLIRDSSWKNLAAGLVSGMLLVFLVGGGLFNWFPWKLNYILLILCIFIVTYLVSYGIHLLENKRMSDKINQRIKERRK